MKTNIRFWSYLAHSS